MLARSLRGGLEHGARWPAHIDQCRSDRRSTDGDYVEVLAQKHHLVLDSVSDLFAPAGRTTILVMWELSVKPIGGGKCEFTNHVRTRATDEFWDFPARQGIPFDVFCAQRQPMSVAHNRQETPFFAASIERHALRMAAAA